MSELHLKLSGFTWITCGLFTKHSEMIKKFREMGDFNYIYKNEFDKAINPKYDGYQRGSASIT